MFNIVRKNQTENSVLTCEERHITQEIIYTPSSRRNRKLFLNLFSRLIFFWFRCHVEEWDIGNRADGKGGEVGGAVDDWRRSCDIISIVVVVKWDTQKSSHETHKPIFFYNFTFKFKHSVGIRQLFWDGWKLQHCDCSSESNIWNWEVCAVIRKKLFNLDMNCFVRCDPKQN